MKKANLFLLILIIAIAASFITVLVIEESKVVQTAEFPMDVRVWEDSAIGINVDPDGFHFGSLGRGQGARRELWIRQVEENVIVAISKRGEMAEWVSFPNNFIAKKGEEKNVSISIDIPMDAKPGNYTGEITVVLRKA